MTSTLESTRDKHFVFTFVIKHVVFVAKVLGVLPVAPIANKNKLTGNACTFKFKKTGLAFVALQLVMLGMMANIANTNFFNHFFQPHSALTLQVICVLACAILRSSGIHLLTFFHRTKSVIECLNESLNILSTIECNTKPKALRTLFLGYFLAFPGGFAIFVRWFTGVSLIIISPSIICNLQENAILFVMIMFFNLVEISFEDINSKITQFNRTSTNLLPQLESLMLRHWQTCDLFADLSACFGLDVALLCWYNLIKIVLLSYYSYFILVTGYTETPDHIVTAFDVPYRFFVVWYLGYKCDLIYKQRNETRKLIAELLVEQNHKLDHSEKAMIKVFLKQIHSRGSHFTAAGLFVLNRAKFYAMLQMAVTYIVVLAQFHSFM